MLKAPAEWMGLTVKSAIGKMGHHKPSGWDFAASRVLYEYNRRSLASELLPFHLL